MSDDEKLKRIIRAMDAKVKALEETPISRSHDGSNDSLAKIMKRINAVQALVDQIEIEIDKLEMRVSAIEHVRFRLRTSGQ
jgi:hypothetical protein